MRTWSQLPDSWPLTAATHPGSILLKTSRFDDENCRSYLFLRPADDLVASSLDEMRDLFSRVEQALDAGMYVAGYLSYECGYHFQGLESIAPSSSELPLAWLGVYRDPLIFNHATGETAGDTSFLSPATSFSVSPSIAEPIRLGITEQEYCDQIRQIQEYIGAGDTYQVNFTDSVELHTAASPADAFRAFTRHQPVAYNALLHVAGGCILSFSPELFFRIRDGKIVTRPMKGTMPRGIDLAADAEAAFRLAHDEKNCAEHLMIVDLLRNDLGRICRMGSVRVEELFSTEKYKTLFQMTSTISGALLPNLNYYEIFRSLFPCGSVTGAPKIRTMQIIRELERRPRGVYTGAIGYIAPDRSAVFNVAIRTLVMKNGEARMGVGSGIVADSEAHDEYQECLLKAHFLVRPLPDFELLDTILWDGEFRFLSMHLDRMEASAAYFDYPFDRVAVTECLIAKSRKLPAGSQKVRMLLDASGQINIMSEPASLEHSSISVCISPERTTSSDVFLRHKTTWRAQYDRMYREARAAGFDEVVFLNEKDHLTEGAISNLFILREGHLLTPPLVSGVLPGIFRRHLLQTDPTVREALLTVADLASADAVFLANSVRGLRRVEHICFDLPQTADPICNRH